MADLKRLRLPARRGLVGIGVAALGTLAAGALLQRRHATQIRQDPEYARLEDPPRGRPLKVVSADGTEIHAEVFGEEGAPTVVLAHGWTEALQYWTYVIDDLLAAGLRAVAYDQRGHSRSARAAGGDYGIARFGEDLEAVLAAALAPGERAILAGHSLGGMSIMAWAADHNVEARACGAVLCNTGMDGLIADNLVLPVVAGRLKETVGRVFMGAAGPLPRISTPLTHAAVGYLAFGPEVTPAQIAFYERMLWDCSPRVRAAVGVSLTSLDLSEALPRLTVPSIVVVGLADRLTPVAHAERMAARLPDCREVMELPDTGHMGPLERPHEVSRAILSLAGEGAAGLADVASA